MSFRGSIFRVRETDFEVPREYFWLAGDFWGFPERGRGSEIVNVRIPGAKMWIIAERE